MNIKVDRVIESQAKKHANKLESDGRFKGMGVEPKQSSLILRQKHVKVRVEDGFSDKLKVLILDATLIGSFFSNKLDLHGTLQILFNLS